jgi:hypothetical protein
MWEPRRLTTLWVSTACYRDSVSVMIITVVLNNNDANISEGQSPTCWRRNNLRNVLREAHWPGRAGSESSSGDTSRLLMMTIELRSTTGASGAATKSKRATFPTASDICQLPGCACPFCLNAVSHQLYSYFASFTLEPQPSCYRSIIWH